MEKSFYEFYTFFSEVVFGLKCKSCREGELYYNDDYIWKVFSSCFTPELKGEEIILEVSKLDSDYLTIPTRLLYLDDEYYGYKMDNVGTSLDKFILKNKPSRDFVIKILLDFKRIMVYLDSMGIIHGDVSISNILIDESDNYHVRLGDITSMIFPGINSKYHIKFLHEHWYKHYGDIKVIDKLAFDYITYLLINFYDDSLEDILDNPDYNFNTVLEMLSKNKGLFKNVCAPDILKDIACVQKTRSLESKNTYLIDCLK